MLVAHDAPRIERFSRTGNEWTLSDVRGLDATPVLPSARVELPLAEIYRRVELAVDG